MLGGLPHLNLHHGTLNVGTKPCVLRFDAGHIGDKYERLTQAFGLPAGTDLADAVAVPNRLLDPPATSGELRVTPDLSPRSAEYAMGDHLTLTNSRLMDCAMLKVLFRGAPRATRILDACHMPALSSRHGGQQRS